MNRSASQGPVERAAEARLDAEECEANLAPRGAGANEPERGAEDAARLLGDLDSGRLLPGSTTALQERLRGVRRRPIPVADAVLAWAAHEAHAVEPDRPRGTGPMLRLRPRDMALATSVLLPAGAVLTLVGA